MAIKSGANSSVSDDATATGQGRVRASSTYARDGRAHAGHDVPSIPRLFARQSGRLREPQPGFDPALAGGQTVLIDEPLPPGPTHVGLGTIRDDRRVFHRQVALVVKAVRHPAANLRRRQQPLVHLLMERMAIVIAVARRRRAAWP